MTRRKVIFFNDLNNSWIVSEEYNGDKAEAERFGLSPCDHNWAEFMAAMDTVNNLADFLKVISFITGSYHATINGVPVPEQANQLPGSRLFVAHNKKELYDKVRLLDEVWEVKRNIPGAHLLDVSAITPVFWDGKEVLGTDTFSYDTVKPGDYVTQAVVDDAMDCLPPASMTARCSQMCEPYSSKLDFCKYQLWKTGAVVVPFGWNLSNPVDFCKRFLFSKAEYAMLTKDKDGPKPKELRGIKKIASIPFGEEQRKCQLYLEDDDLYINHADYFSPEGSLDEIDPMTHLPKRVVYIHKVWLRITNFVPMVKILNPSQIVQKVWPMIQEYHGWPSYEYNMEWERFLEAVAKATVREIK